MNHRKHSAKRLALPALLLMVVLSWPAMVVMVNAQETMTLTKADQGKTTEAKVGQIIRIELPGNPTTGYDWHPIEVDGQYLDVLSKEPKKSGQTNLIGAPSLIVSRFQTKKPGNTTVELAYFRVWEGAATATDRYRINLVIKP
ncbi:MAG: protease inhibitor I42 family protein [Deltaproteobacteria bacterium]|nr:protease inhibitor I42 family protein [Deltaproteobacteria bacterium]